MNVVCMKHNDMNMSYIYIYKSKSNLWLKVGKKRRKLWLKAK